MNAHKRFFFGLILLVGFQSLGAMDLFGNKSDANKLNVFVGDEKRSQLAALESELKGLEEQESEFWKKHSSKVDQIKSAIATTEAELGNNNVSSEFLEKKLLALRSIKQTFADIKSTWKEIILREMRHREFLENYVKDPKFSALQLEKKSLSSFADLQQLNEQIAAQEEKLHKALSDKNETQRDLANRKKKEASADAAYKEKLKLQAEFAQSKTIPGQKIDNLDVPQYGELLDLQVTLAFYEKDLAQLHLKQEEIELATVTSQVAIEEKKLGVLKRKRDLMSRMSLRVDENDLMNAKTQLAEKKKNYLNESEVYSQKIDKLVAQKEEKREGLRALIEKYSNTVKDTSLLTEWSTRPTSMEGYVALSEVGKKQEELALIDREIDLLRAQSNFHKSEFEQEELSSKIVESWYKIKQQIFKTNEDFAKELKQYEAIDAELERERAIFEDKRNAATGHLNVQNRALGSIQDLLKKLRETESTVFSQAPSQYKECLASLEEAQTALSKQVEITGNLIGTYSKILVAVGRARRQAASMTAELQRVSLWHRSGRAISWEGLTNLLPDLYAFMSDVRTLGFSYLASLSFSSTIGKWLKLLQDPVAMFYLILKVLLAFGLFFFLGRYLPVMSGLLARVSSEIRGAYLMSLMLSLLLDFLYRYLTSFFVWSVLFTIFGMRSSPEITTILFYLISIFYFLYLSQRFTVYFAKFNEERDFVFFSASFQERFIVFLNWLLFSTVIIFLFREAFIVATYTKSELPDILLASYSIIVRVLLLSLIRKEDLLSIIPSKTPFWSAVWRFVDRYYYPVLLCFVIIMVMMDPHIGGYNNLVYYLVWGIIGTLIVAKVFYELYIFLRSSSSFLFFSSDGETLKERFQASKVLYGTSIILLFFGLTFICMLAIAWVWGKPISLHSIVQFFLEDRLTIKGAADELQKLNILDLIRTFSFIPLGLLIGFIVDRFIVHRIFSVLLVNPGVHNAVSTITYYITIIAVITIGLWSEGFGFVIAYYIAPILLGIAWALRDLFNDFVAYFVILIQRPLKVGDYIKIDEETSGVVRTISPRAVVLRRKKGFCLIIPNSRIVRETIVNWDYHLNFISCPDVHVTVPYRFDPERVNEILLQATGMTQNVLKTPAPMIRLDEFSESGFYFMVRVFTTPENTLIQWEIASALRLTIVRLLRENDMEIAFPVRVIRTSTDQIPPLGGLK